MHLLPMVSCILFLLLVLELVRGDDQSIGRYNKHSRRGINNNATQSSPFPPSSSPLPSGSPYSPPTTVPLTPRSLHFMVNHSNNSLLKSATPPKPPLIQQYESLELWTQKAAYKLVYESLLPTFEDIFDKTNVSIGCQSAITKVLHDVTTLKRYASQMLDSSGRFPPPGLMEGTLTDLGRFDECLSIDQILDGEDSPVTTHIRGQYCSILIRLPLPPRPRFHTLCNQIPELTLMSKDDTLFRWLGQNMQSFYYTPFRIGVCTPIQCSPQDINVMIHEVTSSFNLSGNVLNMKCQVNGKPSSLTRTQLASFFLFGLVITFVSVGTLIDILHLSPDKSASFTPVHPSSELKLVSKVAGGSPAEPPMWVKGDEDGEGDCVDACTNLIPCGPWTKMFLCFSARRNGCAILNLNPIKSTGDSLDIIHGLRVITMGWIILGHTYGLVNPMTHSEVFKAKDMYTEFRVQGLLNATLSVDTFFFISGLLTVYVSWTRISQTRSLPAISFTLLRYLRLTPAYIAVIGLAFIFPLFSSGPLWDETVTPIAASCYTSWWTNLLYVNNFVKTDQLCLMHSWYLSNDMQFHLFSLIFLFLLLRSKLLAIIYIVVTIIACTSYSAVETYVNQYPPTIVSTSPVVEDRWNYILNYYYKPWPHLPSYCIGLVTGYIITSRSRLRLTDAQKRTSWVFIGFLSLLVLYGVYPWNLGWNIPPEVTALYSSTFRTIWTGCCAWFTYCLLSHDKDSLMSSCLSWKGLLPLSRLTYMAFLVHPFVIWYQSGSARERFTPTHFNYFHLFMGHYMLTYIVSFVWGILFESPFMALTKQFFTPKPSTGSRKVIPSKELNQKDKKKRKKSFLYHVAFDDNKCSSSVLYVNSL